MAIERWDPFREAISLRDAMNSLLQDSFVRPGGMGQGSQATLPLDVAETENEFVVKADSALRDVARVTPPLARVPREDVHPSTAIGEVTESLSRLREHAGI